MAQSVCPLRSKKDNHVYCYQDCAWYDLQPGKCRVLSFLDSAELQMENIQDAVMDKQAK